MTYITGGKDLLTLIFKTYPQIYILPPSRNISKRNSFSLSQNISKKDKLLLYLILFLKKIIFFNKNFCIFS